LGHQDPGLERASHLPTYLRSLKLGRLRIAEIELAAHDGPDQEQLDLLNFRSRQVPVRTMDYWRWKVVRYTIAGKSHPMTGVNFGEH
jgi:hypothetical protein